MLELLQFRYSPYNEKVRWALDLKNVAHSRTPLLPGPHFPRVRKVTGGQSTTTPVLVADGQVVRESGAIIDWLESNFPEPRLMPTESDRAAEVRAVAQHFDTNIGPRSRRAVLAVLLQTPRYFAAVFGAGHSRWQRAIYALTVPLAAPLVRKGNGITGAASVEDGYTAFAEGLTYVADHTAASGYLVGDSFTLADLTAASMLAMCVDPPASPMERPQPRPSAFDALVARYARHPGADWVRQIYARHRCARADFNGASGKVGRATTT